jgi:hypothetical protein
MVKIIAIPICCPETPRERRRHECNQDGEKLRRTISCDAAAPTPIPSRMEAIIYLTRCDNSDLHRETCDWRWAGMEGLAPGLTRGATANSPCQPTAIASPLSSRLKIAFNCVGLASRLFAIGKIGPEPIRPKRYRLIDALWKVQHGRGVSDLGTSLLQLGIGC